jgi:hypothetical protein
MKYRFIADPGHAWLEVDMSEAIALGVKPSAYSYKHNGMWYLEEDCDAPLFVAAKKARGEPVEFVEVYQENTPIRTYNHIRGQG